MNERMNGKVHVKKKKSEHIGSTVSGWGGVDGITLIFTLRFFTMVTQKNVRWFSQTSFTKMAQNQDWRAPVNEVVLKVCQAWEQSPWGVKGEMYIWVDDPCHVSMYVLRNHGKGRKTKWVFFCLFCFVLLIFQWQYDRRVMLGQLDLFLWSRRQYASPPKGFFSSGAGLNCPELKKPFQGEAKHLQDQKSKSSCPNLTLQFSDDLDDWERPQTQWLFSYTSMF